MLLPAIEGGSRIRESFLVFGSPLIEQNEIDEGLIKTSNYSISEMTERDNRIP